MRRQGSHHSNGPARGQISVLIIFSLIPLFMLFAFVVNVGMLVNAKISLQNAADMAAYAGAATQARQLTNISYINYFMRQVYKKFVYKYYVIGNISLKCYPRPGNPAVCPPPSGLNFDWQNRENSGALTGFPGIPMVCISLSPESNPCQKAQPVRIVRPPPCIPIDPTCGALRDAALAIAAIQQKSCKGNSSINGEVLGNWLWATDFDIQMQNQAGLQGLISDDIGLITEELLLKFRAKNIAEFINVKPRKGLTVAGLKGVEAGADPAKFERTSLAMRSVLGNLNPNVFNPEDITFSELLPNTPMLNLDFKQADINVGWGFMDGDDPEKGCQMQLEIYKARPNVLIEKKGNSLVYYAVKVTAKARVLFNPFPFGNPADSIEMTAYAAAMPFGSRIGPPFVEDEWTKAGQALTKAPSTKETVRYPFMKLAEGFSWESTAVLLAFHNNLKEATGGATAGGTVGRQNLIRGIRTAQLPDEFEIGRYNIPIDSDNINRNSLKFQAFYETGAAGGGDKNFTFWAPVKAVNSGDEFEKDMDTELDGITFISAGGGATGVAQLTKNALKNAMQGKIGSLLGRLSGRGNFNVMKIPDPLGVAFFKTNPPFPQIPGKVAAEDSKKIGFRLATSYTSEHDKFYFENGRVGYSVKFIPFKMLLKQPGTLSSVSGDVRWKTVGNDMGPEQADLAEVAH